MKYGALLVTEANGAQRQYDIDLPSVLVGSGEGSGILLQDPSIGERHAKLLVESGVLLVEDMGSAAGTRVDGRRVEPGERNRVEPGHEVQFGKLKARYLEPLPLESEWSHGGVEQGPDDEPGDSAIQPLSRILLRAELPRTPFAAGSLIQGVLHVENRGRVVDEISLKVSGIPESWLHEWQPRVRLVTGASAELPIVIRPPVEPEALAGNHDVVVTATSGVDGRQAVEIARIEILPFEALEMDIDPNRAEERFQVVLGNAGNAPVNVRLAVVEADERMRFDLQAPGVTLGPGEERRVGLRARMARRPLFGRNEVFIFTVAANSHTAAFDQVERFGQLLVKPRLQPWKLPLQVLFALAVVGTVFAVFWFDWPVRADVDDFNVPAIPIINEKEEEVPAPTVAKPAATALAGAKKDDAAAALAKLEERYAGVHLCGTAKDAAAAARTPAPSSPRGPLFRQDDAAWAKDIYAAAGQAGPKSTCGKTLAQCGCEVTSMATVLALLQLVTMPDGEPLNPGTLNKWFQQEAVQDGAGWTSRGYAYGDVVWSAANALSAQANRSTPGTPRVRYLGAGSGADAEIKSALDAKIPVILEVPGHYIAATGYDGDKITISDPYYADRKTLDFYKGKVLGSVLFQPADDLSALTITAPAEMRIRVTDPSGRVVGTVEGASGAEAETKAKRDIPGSSYTFKDAWRDPNCIESAPPAGAGVHQIHISAPEAGTYKVEITNAKEGGTSAVMHIYDRDGNLRIQREEGTGNRTVTVQVGD
ncbi:MAG: hypothetical protein C0506_09690 [Anaerolinea sp.]|nr:hypothetical protein [Anaerolinea sp.]